MAKKIMKKMVSKASTKSISKKPAAKVKAVKTKSITKSINKSILKLATKALSVVGKTKKLDKVKKQEKPSKAVLVEKTKKVTAKAQVKPAAKTSSKVAEFKPAIKILERAKKSASEEPDTGDTLIEMARQEMAAIKIGQTADKAEKASKLKAIKVERGNLADEKAKWQELNKRHGKDKAVAYKMTETFESSQPVQHKTLGWGFILSNDNDRLEVLFENGIKMLISNYKPN